MGTRTPLNFYPCHFCNFVLGDYIADDINNAHSFRIGQSYSRSRHCSQNSAHKSLISLAAVSVAHNRAGPLVVSPSALSPLQSCPEMAPWHHIEQPSAPNFKNTPSVGH